VVRRPSASEPASLYSGHPYISPCYYTRLLVDVLVFYNPLHCQARGRAWRPPHPPLCLHFALSSPAIKMRCVLALTWIAGFLPIRTGAQQIYDIVSASPETCERRLMQFVVANDLGSSEVLYVPEPGLFTHKLWHQGIHRRCRHCCDRFGDIPIHLGIRRQYVPLIHTLWAIISHVYSYDQSSQRLRCSCLITAEDEELG
jgi:hypothetical protein